MEMEKAEGVGEGNLAVLQCKAAAVKRLFGEIETDFSRFLFVGVVLLIS